MKTPVPHSLFKKSCRSKAFKAFQALIIHHRLNPRTTFEYIFLKRYRFSVLDNVKINSRKEFVSEAVQDFPKN